MDAAGRDGWLKTEDLAKMGQLLLQKGEWNGRQLIPAEWVSEMSKKQVESINPGTRLEEAEAKGMTKETSDWMQGYDHGSMPQSAYKILKDHIKRITAKMTSALPKPVVKTERQAE